MVKDLERIIGKNIEGVAEKWNSKCTHIMHAFEKLNSKCKLPTYDLEKPGYL